MAVICEMSCGRGRAEDCRPPPLCGAVISPPEHKTTRAPPRIGRNSVQRVNSDRIKAERRLIDKLSRIWKTFLFQRCFVLQHATRTLLCKSCNKRGSRHPVIAFWNRYRDIINDSVTANLHRTCRRGRTKDITCKDRAEDGETLPSNKAQFERSHSV